MHNGLKKILSEWRLWKVPQPLSRDFRITEELYVPHKALVITGFRRVGKTYMLFDALHHLLQTHTKEDVIYINFEDERLLFQTETLSNLLPEIISMYGKKPKYLFLDEIQNIPNWSRWVRRILDTEDIQLVITGSSSKMSSYELPTELRGRSISRTIYPLTFQEYLHFTNERIETKHIVHNNQETARFEYVFKQFLFSGALPEVVLSDITFKKEILQEYFQTFISRDLIERYGIKNETSLRFLLKLVLNSTQITVSKLHDSLKGLGAAIGKETIIHYLSYIESGYFLSQLPIFSSSVRKELYYPRKVYCIDTGFIPALSTKLYQHVGQLFETYVYWYLKQRYAQLFYFRDEQEYEVDFMAMNDADEVFLYQACFDLHESEETLEREVRALERGKEAFSDKKVHASIMTASFERPDLKGVRIIGPEEFVFLKMQ